VPAEQRQKPAAAKGKKRGEGLEGPEG
jgi:hypothetical protein